MRKEETEEEKEERTWENEAVKERGVRKTKNKSSVISWLRRNTSKAGKCNC